jgi:hypothetical protein
LSSFELYGLALAASVIGVTLLLGGWDWVERRRLWPNPSDEDAAYFASRDVRRRIVAAIMVLMAGLVLVGSRTPHELEGRPNPLFVWVWVAAIVLVIPLLALAMVDWLAVRRHARRHRNAILREGMKLLEDELKRRAPPHTNGQVPREPEA